MFDHTIYKENSPEKFDEACELIEQSFTDIQKDKLLIDVDGSTYQRYTKDGKIITVYDDYDVGAVYVIADLDLSHIFN
jgi:hypothetical protein